MRRVRGMLWNVIRPHRGAVHAGVRVAKNASTRYASVAAEGLGRIGEHAYVSGRLTLGYASTLGHHVSIVGGDVVVGRYCQFGPYAAAYAMNHPVDHATTYVNSALFSGRLKRLQPAAPVRLGHDVWVGHGAVVLPGVSVGAGAVIGANAVVTRDVPPYAVVVGNPARVIRSRFDARVVDALLRANWWDATVDELCAYEELFAIDLVAEPERGLEWLSTHVDARGRLPSAGLAATQR